MTTFLLTSFVEVGTARETCRVVCRLYQMKVCSVFTVSCQSCGAPLELS